VVIDKPQAIIATEQTERMWFTFRAARVHFFEVYDLVWDIAVKDDNSLEKARLSPMRQEARNLPDDYPNDPVYCYTRVIELRGLI